MSLGNQTGTITLRIIAEDLASGNFSKAVAGMDAMARKGGLMGSVMQGVGMQMGFMLNPIGLLASGVGAVGDALSGAMQAAIDGQESTAKLNAALGANVVAWNGNDDAINRVIDSRLQLGFSDNEQQDALAQLVVHTKDAADALDAERTAMDLARLKGTDLETAANLVGKAWDGNTEALKRMGIELPKGVDGMRAMESITQQVGGQAQAFSDTLAGKQAGLNAAVDHLNESIGSLTIGPATDFLSWLGNMISPTEKAVTSLDSVTDSITVQTAALTAQTQAATAQKEATDVVAQSWTDFANTYNNDFQLITTGHASERNQFIKDEEDIAKTFGDSSESVGRYYDAIISGGGTAADAYKSFSTDVQKADQKINGSVSFMGNLFEQHFGAIEQAARAATQAMSAFMRAGFSSGWSHYVPPSAANPSGGGGNGFLPGGGGGGSGVNIHFNGMVTPPSPADAQRIGNIIGPIVARHLQSSGHL